MLKMEATSSTAEKQPEVAHGTIYCTSIHNPRPRSPLFLLTGHATRSKTGRNTQMKMNTRKCIDTWNFFSFKLNTSLKDISRFELKSKLTDFFIDSY